MRDTNERIKAVKRRAKEIKQKRKERIVTVFSVCACLCWILGASFAMPGFMKSVTDGTYQLSMSGSIFNNSGALGYILIGVLAFALGVCVTVLCVLIRRKNKEDDHG